MVEVSFAEDRQVSIPGIGGKLNPSIKCHKCKSLGHYRNKFSEADNIQGATLMQVVDDACINNSDEKSKVGFVQVEVYA